MRRFDFPVDLPHAKAVNQTVAEVRRLRVSAIVLAVLFAAAAVWLILIGRAWSFVVAAVVVVAALTAAWVAVWAPRKVGAIQDLYRDSPLVPAVVSELRPRGMTLLALVDIAKPETGGHRYALVARDVTAVPGHRVRVGERVPSVAVLSDRTTRNTSGVWQMVSPMPIAWGTRDASVLREAAAAIDETEWKVLEGKLSRSDEVAASEERRLVLDPKDLPADLR
ncbi:DUF3239 domain-containing protein [Rhodococcus indonesiensis]|uniref:DUF3239 domain-containing protein n=1 Tax=Rhodococcus indonesiensis TaxID=3055869 RepID=UPI0039F6D003